MTPPSRVTKLCDDFIEAGWLTALIVATLFFNPHAEDAFESNRFLVLRSLAVVLMAAAAVQWLETARLGGLAALGERWRTAVRRPLVVPALLLTVGWLAATAASLDPVGSWWGVLPRLHGSYSALAYLAIFLVMAPRIGDPARQTRWVTTLLLSSLGLCVYGLAQWLGWDPLTWSGVLADRVMAQQGNPIFLGAFLAMTIPLTLARALLAWQEGRSASLVLTSLAGLQITTLWLTGSRGPAFALLIGLVLALSASALAYGRRRLILIFYGSAVVAMTMAAVGLGGRLAELTSQDGTAAQRWSTWQATVTMLADAPHELPLGFGPEMMATAFLPYVPSELPGMRWEPDLYQDRAHNAVLDSLISVGVVGTVIYLAILCLALALAVRHLGLVPDRRWAIGLGVALTLTPLTAAAVAGWTSPGLVGLATGLGPIAGIALYLASIAVFGPQTPKPDLHRIAWGGAILAALVSHIAELQVGIATVASQVLFWMIAAWLAGGGPSPREESKDQTHETATASLLIALVVVTHAFALWPSAGSGGIAPFVAILSGILVSGCFVVFTSCEDQSWRDILRRTLPWCGAYLFFHAALAPSPGAAAPIVSLYLVQLALGVLVLTRLLGRRPPRRTQGDRPRVLVMAAYLGVMIIGLFAAMTTNRDWMWAGLSMKNGRQAFAEQRFDVAQAYFEDAVRRVPAADEHHLALARASIRQAAATENSGLRQGRFERIEKSLDDRRQQRPLHPQYATEAAYLHSRWSQLATDPEDRRQHLELASQAYADAVRLAPNDASIHRGWGAVLLDSGEISAAQNRLERAVELGPRSIPGLLMLGRTQLEDGRFDAAGRTFARALEVDDRHATQMIAGVARASARDWRAQRDLAVLSAVEGQRQQALAAASAAVRLAPPSHRAALEELYLWLRQHTPATPQS